MSSINSHLFDILSQWETPSQNIQLPTGQILEMYEIQFNLLFFYFFTSENIHVNRNSHASIATFLILDREARSKGCTKRVCAQQMKTYNGVYAAWIKYHECPLVLLKRISLKPSILFYLLIVFWYVGAIRNFP